MGTGRSSTTEEWLSAAQLVAGDHVLVVGTAPTDFHDSLAGRDLQLHLLDWSQAWSTQLPTRVALAAVVSVPAGHAQQAALHAAVMHLDTTGHLLTIGLPDDSGEVAGLHCVAEGHSWVLWRRPPRTTVHDLLDVARATIVRYGPRQLHECLASTTPITVIDTRTPTDRDRFGTIAGSLHVPRTLLEFHLDPANGYTHPQRPSFDDHVVVVCNGGYSSSLAAANLVAIGYHHVGDLVGGMAAWASAGLPLEPPDHCHLELPHALDACGHTVPTNEV